MSLPWPVSPGPIVLLDHWNPSPLHPHHLLISWSQVLSRNHRKRIQPINMLLWLYIVYIDELLATYFSLVIAYLSQPHLIIIYLSPAWHLWCKQQKHCQNALPIHKIPLFASLLLSLYEILPLIDWRPLITQGSHFKPLNQISQPVEIHVSPYLRYLSLLETQHQQMNECLWV